MKKEKRGGARVGTGPKPKYNEKTETVSFRVPKSKKTEIQNIVKSKLTEYINKNKAQ